MPTADALIIGGGLHGCSTALHLARRGVKAVVLEKDYPGRHASGVNAGGVRRLGRDLAEIPLSVAAMELWHGIGDLVDDDCGFECHGQVKVAESDAELEFLRRRVATVRALGFEHEELVDATALRTLVPAVAEHCTGAIVCRDDGAADPYRTTAAFRRKAEALGASIHEGEPALRIIRAGREWQVETPRERYTAPILVNCAGAWADRIAAELGETVPVLPSAFMLMVSNRLPHFIDPVVGATGRPLSFKQMPNGTVVIGGGYKGRLERDTNWTELDFRGLSASAATVHDLFPAMRGAQIVRAWAGIEARMPDDIPVIGPSETQANAWHAFGFSGHGFQLAPVVGAILAELITTGRSNLPVAPFRIGRFRA